MPYRQLRVYCRISPHIPRMDWIDLIWPRFDRNCAQICAMLSFASRRSRSLCPPQKNSMAGSRSVTASMPGWKSSRVARSRPSISTSCTSLSDPMCSSWGRPQHCRVDAQPQAQGNRRRIRQEFAAELARGRPCSLGDLSCCPCRDGRGGRCVRLLARGSSRRLARQYVATKRTFLSAPSSLARTAELIARTSRRLAGSALFDMSFGSMGSGADSRTIILRHRGKYVMTTVGTTHTRRKSAP